MSEDCVKILCTGDLHLGRYPSRVRTNQHTFSVAHIWARTVDFAIAQGVDLVALTGDVVDRANRFFEAIGPLERGLRRLGEAGISTFAVAGNHDFDVLPRVADALDDECFHLLGRGGRWESRIFERDGAPLLRLVGWSFPQQHFPQSPLDGLARPEADGIPTVGLLHADLDQGASRYAPVSSAQLGGCGFAAWLLGHIHRPTETRAPGESLLLYPGSPQPLDPGERGVHGPWLIEVAPGRPATTRQIALATVRYSGVELDVSSLQRVDDFEKLMLDSLREHLCAWTQPAATAQLARALPECAMIRLSLVGRTRFRRELERRCAPIVADFELQVDGILARVDKISVQTRPTLDLKVIARGNDPPALLARLLVALDGDAELPTEHQPLFTHLRRELRQVHLANAFGPLRAEGLLSTDIDAARLRRLVKIEGVRLLEELLSQKRAPDTQGSMSAGGLK